MPSHTLLVQLRPTDIETIATSMISQPQLQGMQPSRHRLEHSGRPGLPQDRTMQLPQAGSVPHRSVSRCLQAGADAQGGKGTCSSGFSEAGSGAGQTCGAGPLGAPRWPRGARQTTPWRAGAARGAGPRCCPAPRRPGSAPAPLHHRCLVSGAARLAMPQCRE